jgi:hypothetical protein
MNCKIAFIAPWDKRWSRWLKKVEIEIGLLAIAHTLVKTIN